MSSCHESLLGPPGPLGGGAGCRFCLMAGAGNCSIEEFKLMARCCMTTEVAQIEGETLSGEPRVKMGKYALEALQLMCPKGI